MIRILLSTIQLYIHKKNNPILWTKTSEQFLKILLKYVKKTDNIIELGCGTAHVSFMLAKMGYHITLNEIRQESLTRARQAFEAQGVKAKYTAGDLFKIEGRFDLAWNSGLIQCFPDQMKKKFIYKLSINFRKIVLFFPDTTDSKKEVGKNMRMLPGVDDAKEYDIANIPSIVKSRFTVVHFGVLNPKSIGLPYKMYWIYGENS